MPSIKEGLIGPGPQVQSVSFNMPTVQEFAEQLKEFYGPMIAEGGDYTPLAAYVTDLVRECARQTANQIVFQISEAQKEAQRNAQAAAEAEERDRGESSVVDLSSVVKPESPPKPPKRPTGGRGIQPESDMGEI